MMISGQWSWSAGTLFQTVGPVVSKLTRGGDEWIGNLLLFLTLADSTTADCPEESENVMYIDEVHPYTLSLDKIREMNPKGTSLQVVPTVYTERIPPDARKRYSKWVFRFWESVMDHSLCPICLAAT